MVNRIEVFEAIVDDIPFCLHVPLYRMPGGILMRVVNGERETRAVISMEPMSLPRLGQIGIVYAHAKWLLTQVSRARV